MTWEKSYLGEAVENIAIAFAIKWMPGLVPYGVYAELGDGTRGIVFWGFNFTAIIFMILAALKARKA